MAFKAVLAVSSVLLVQSALGQYLGAPCGLAGPGPAVPTLAGYGAGLAAPGLAGANWYGAGCAAGVASTGGGLPVSSTSPIAPVGVSVLSENAYEGILAAGGNLPFLGSVGVEGVLPTAGAAAVSYGCGDGSIGIATEGPIGTGILTGSAFNPSLGVAAPVVAGVNGYGLGGVAGYNGLGSINGVTGYGVGGLGCGCGYGIY